MKLRLPAIKGFIGDWVYYQTIIPFQELKNRIDNDHSIREWDSLDDHLQRKLSNRSKKIKEYLLREDSRFFNTAIIGLFGDTPKWYTFSFEPSIIPEYDLDSSITSSIGILELTGLETLFSIDGQHRIEGIKQALLKDSEKFENDQLPIIIISHTDNREGKRRTRRLFSEINSKAHSVSGLDKLITDEDHPAYINSRLLFAEYKVFNKEKFIKLNHTANIDVNASELTTILNLFEINKILYKNHFVFNDYRPKDIIINRLQKRSELFWNRLVHNYPPIRSVLKKKNKKVSDYRNPNGGDLLFRPLGLKLLAEVYSQAEQENIGWTIFWNKINKINWELSGDVWCKLAWNDIEKKIEVRRYKFLKLYLCWLLDLNTDKNYILEEYNKFAFDILKESDYELLPEKIGI